ncbi:MAG: hypothetical protein ACOYB0_10685, partial [Polynucleobacter sp.]
EDDPGIIDLSTFVHLLESIANDYYAHGEDLPILYPWFFSEPLMIPNLDEYLEAATKLGYKINLTTNGTLFKQWPSLITSNINYHILVISIDGLEPKTYQAIRGAGTDKITLSVSMAETLMDRNNLNIPICIKLTNKGIEWAEIVEFTRAMLADPFVKMVSISRAFDDSNGPLVARHACRYLSEFFIIQHDLTIAPCCMRGRAVKQGMGKIDIDNPMESFFSPERAMRIEDLLHDDPRDYCLGCMSAYTGSAIEGTIDGEPFGKAGPIKTKQDFYNTFYFNPDYKGAGCE